MIKNPHWVLLIIVFNSSKCRSCFLLLIPLSDFLTTEHLVTEEDPEVPKKRQGGSRNSLKSPQELPIKEKAVECEEDVFVVKWYDYSSKYGLGYVLSNGAVGVCFNDGTKLIASNKEYQPF